MKNYAKILFSILTAMICATALAADQPACKKSGKNCPMNDGKACNCGKQSSHKFCLPRRRPGDGRTRQLAAVWRAARATVHFPADSVRTSKAKALHR